ncbi:MAG: M48 family peptidase, partial [Phycisphaerae bacterium]|nr:M48 family peptidase [Phycisphaerae bacterium]
EQVAGLHRNLQACFNRVNGRYFDGCLARPRLTWSRTFSGRRFGHYDPIRDTVMVSAILDRVAVAEHVLDFVMYHELLHKALGVGWRNGRQAVHTPEFREKERQFEQYAAATAAIETLAAMHV